MSLVAADLRVTLGRREVLRGVSVRLHAGEVVAFVGPNGAGKTTLLRTLAGDLRPSTGSVSLDGRELSDWAPLDLARRRAVLPQRPDLHAAFRVRDVVALGRYPHRTPARVDAEHVEAGLRDVGLLDRADDPFTALSGGEQQRVMFARVLAQLDGGGPGTHLLLDEPTSALDLAWQRRVLELARALAGRGVAVGVVLHDLAAAAWAADRVLALADGELLADDTPARVLTPALLRRAYGVEARCVPVDGHGFIPLVVGLAPAESRRSP